MRSKVYKLLFAEERYRGLHTMKRKAQAALEFLTTYGWAFLVILIMIGALAYFGVLSPSNLVPDKCLASSGFTCTESVSTIGTSNVMIAKVKNGLEQITFDGANVTTVTGSGCGAPIVTTITSGTIAAGAVFDVTVSCTGTAVVEGERPTFAVTADYTPSGKTLQKQFTLEVSNKLVN
jgi:hypothetical protein